VYELAQAHVDLEHTIRTVAAEKWRLDPQLTPDLDVCLAGCKKFVSNCPEGADAAASAAPSTSALLVALRTAAPSSSPSARRRAGSVAAAVRGEPRKLHVSSEGRAGDARVTAGGLPARVMELVHAGDEQQAFALMQEEFYRRGEPSERVQRWAAAWVGYKFALESGAIKGACLNR